MCKYLSIIFDTNGWKNFGDEVPSITTKDSQNSNVKDQRLMTIFAKVVHVPLLSRKISILCVKCFYLMSNILKTVEISSW